MKRLILFVFVLTISTVVPVTMAQEHSGHDHSAQANAEKVGTVHFPVSCTPATQQQFERAVSMLHSFWYDEAEKAFADVASKDPECGMAYWGMAMSVYHPLWAPPSAQELERGTAAATKARAAKKQTAREKAYIEAVSAIYATPGADFGERNASLASAMERVHNSYPDDTEATIFYALALRATASPGDKSYAVQKKVGKLLEPLFEQQPDHPGLAHYIIHDYDYPELAPLGLNAARHYSAIAPSAPHALHMPSHIFTRLGLWQDSIQSNTESAKAARENARQSGSTMAISEELHAMDYLVYAYLQRGEIKAAQKVADEARQISGADWKIFSATYAAAAIPARMTIETRRWADARWLPEPTFSGGSYWTDVANGIVYWARAVGAARTGAMDQARGDMTKLEAIHDKLAQAKKQDGADTTEVMRLSAAGWIALAGGQKDEAVRLLRASADLEDRTDKHPVTPGPVLPAREQLADMLAELGQPADALREYEASLRVSPNRFNGLLGAALAAKMAGDTAKARSYYSTLLKVAPNADTERLEDANKKLVSSHK
jgi:tetratricopeptide (TPR) repeat protein